MRVSWGKARIRPFSIKESPVYMKWRAIAVDAWMLWVYATFLSLSFSVSPSLCLSACLCVHRSLFIFIGLSFRIASRRAARSCGKSGA